MGKQGAASLAQHLSHAITAYPMSAQAPSARRRVWLFDLDNTLHDATHAVFHRLDKSMTQYIVDTLAIEHADADRLRRHYWQRYGATLLGLEKHHGIRAAHFLDETHRMPGLEADLRLSARDRAAIKRLPGRKIILTNAPAEYAQRVLTRLDLAGAFEQVVSIEGMRCFGRLRPKPDARMLRIVLARMKLPPTRTVLVEDTVGHLRAARALGMGTVWMQRYLRPGGMRPVGATPAVTSSARGSWLPHLGVRLHRRPSYVHARIRSLFELVRWRDAGGNW